LIEKKSTPTIMNCIIRQNMAVGGGIYSNGAPEISKCNIYNNNSAESGGGIYIQSSPPRIENCKIIKVLIGMK
jgi:hypothetical protein